MILLTPCFLCLAGATLPACHFLNISPRDVPSKWEWLVKKIGPDFIDYWQGRFDPASSGSRFGVRLREGRIWALIKLGDGPPNTPGVGYPIPVKKIENLPAYMGTIVDDHLLNYPSSDLMDVLTGK